MSKDVTNAKRTKPSENQNTFHSTLYPYWKIPGRRYSEGQKGCNVCKSLKDAVIA
jgi:hypothetical protein